MGEKSKETGEQGEKLVHRLLALMGWSPLESNLTIKCVRSQKHAQKDSKSRQTHGIDLFYSYRSPLVEFTEKVVCVSVKATSREYKSSIVSDFRNYLVDAAQAAECLQHSERMRDIKQKKSPSSVVHHEVSSIIFFLSLADDSDISIVGKVKNSQIPAELKFRSIQLIDNAAASFAYDTIMYAKENSASFEFDYYLSSQNYRDDQIPYSGRIMPAEYLSSPMIYLRMKDKEGRDNFCISLNEDFDSEGFQRLLNLATDLTRNLSKELTFLFRSYNETNDRATVNTILALEGERAAGLKISVAELGRDFRNLLND